MTVTPEDVRDVAFDKPPLGRRGYDEGQVDAFLDRVELTLAGSDSLTVDDVQRVAFGKGRLSRRGYDEDQVDAFLDAVCAELAARNGYQPS